MIRICRSLHEAGYKVTLIGRRHRHSPALQPQPFHQIRMPVIAEKGFLFYCLYNIQLLFRLMSIKADALCAIDLDTILPVWIVSRFKNCTRIFDAHEWFCEMKELQHRPVVRSIWKQIERLTLPHFKHGYTVSPGIVSLIRQEYGHEYALIRNIPPWVERKHTERKERFIIYQGAVNEGRCFEMLIPAMVHVDWPLHIYGTGNFMEQTRTLIRIHGLEGKVFLKGSLLPEDLRQLTPTASIGISLFEDSSLHNRVSLANRFFDFIHAGVPQICSDLPAYREINDRYDIALLLEATTIENIANALNKLMCDELLYYRLSSNCRKAARDLNWQHEQEILREFYSSLNL